MTEYVFTNRNITKGVSANEVAEELERIADKYGALEASKIVKESRPKDAVLHDSFEWKNAVAADLYRQHQARSIVRCVAIVSPETAEPEPIYVHVPKASETDRGGYVPTSVVVSDEDMLDRALTEMLARLDSAQRSLETLERAVESAKQPKQAAARVRRAAKALGEARSSLQDI